MERVTTRGRPKGSRGRGKAKRGRKRQIVSDEDESIETNANNVDEIQEDPVSENNVTQENPEIINATTETNKMPSDEITGNHGDVSISEEADHDDEELELEAPSFTTMQRNVPQVMLRLNWDHKVNLIGEKVLNPMIYCCDQCQKPILVYGRMIPCKHVFCLACGRTEVMSKQCPRCKDKVVRVEQARLGTVFMCTHGGSRYGSAGCRRTYLSQRDLQAHINHRHVMVQPPVPDIKNMTDKQLSTAPPSVVIDQQQSPSLLLRKDSSTSLFPRIANDNNHHQHSHTNQQQSTPTKKFISQDSGGFYNQQHNQFGSSNSSGPSAQNNFFQQQSYHHQNFNNSNNSMGHYSQQQGQHQQQNQHHQQPQWNQYYR